MALDIKGFVTPEQEFGGLGQLGEVFAQQRQRKAAEGQRANAQAKATQEYLSAFLDPKEFMTATVNDPYITSRLANIMNKGMELAKTKGMDANMLYAALSPEVNRLSRDVQSIKELERQRKQAEDALKGKKGIDVPKFNENFKKRAYFNEDGSIKSDLSQVDPTYNYVDEVLGNDDVYTSEGIDEWVKKQGANTTSADKVIQGGNKAYRRAKLEVTAPYFMQPKEEKGIFTGEFEPKHEYWAQDGQEMESEVIDPATGKPVLGTNGKPIKQKVKLLDQNTYNAILSDPENRAAAAYINQEVRKMTKGLGISPNSDNYNMYARKIGYDILNNAARPKTSYKELVEQKAAPIIINNNDRGSGSGGGRGGSPANYMKVYDDIKSKVDQNAEEKTGNLTVKDSKLGKEVVIKDYVPINSLYETQQNVIMEAVNKKRKIYEFYTPAQLFLRKTREGDVGIYSTSDNQLITRLDKESADVSANKQLGVKAKSAALAEAQKGENTAPQKASGVKLGKGSLDNLGKK